MLDGEKFLCVSCFSDEDDELNKMRRKTGRRELGSTACIDSAPVGRLITNADYFSPVFFLSFFMDYLRLCTYKELLPGLKYF